MQQLEKVGEELTRKILQAVEESLLRNRLGTKVRPWWTEEWEAFLKDMMKTQGNMKKDYDQGYKKIQYLDTRNKYFQKIKIAKKNHWNWVLVKEDPTSIFKSFSYTKDKIITKLPATQEENG